MKRLILVSSLGIWAYSCEKPAEPATQVQANQNDVDGETAEPSVPETPEFSAYEAFITSISGLRLQPTKDRKITDKDGKKTSNWRTTLYRGETVSVIEEQEGWVRAKASDDSEGWLAIEGVLKAEGVKLATVAQETQTFRRPDVTQLDAKRKLDVGTLLFILREKDQFAEVNYAGSRSLWLTTDKLTTDSNEVGAAKIVTKIRHIEKKEPKTKDELLALAESTVADTVVLKEYKELEAALKAENDAEKSEAEVAEEESSKTATGEETPSP